MSEIYKVLGVTENNDLRVKCISALPDGCKKGNNLYIAGKSFGLFWWDAITENAICGSYSPQFFNPEVYTKNSDIYFELANINSLTGKTPLNRFSWNDDPDPVNESDLHKIILEE